MAEEWLAIDPDHTYADVESASFPLTTSLGGVKIKQATKCALRWFLDRPHDTMEVKTLMLHLDGGGTRSTREGNFPATWSVVVSTEAWGGPRSFFGFFGGRSYATLPMKPMWEQKMLLQ